MSSINNLVYYSSQLYSPWVLLYNSFYILFIIICLFLIIYFLPIIWEVDGKKKGSGDQQPF